MAIKKRSINEKTGYTDYPHLNNNENNSNPNQPSHLANLPTNFNLKSISLEDCDQAVFTEFNNRFLIAENLMPIVLLDAELASMKEQNYKQYDKDKEYLNGPFLTMYRKESKPKYRTNPTTKKVIYAIPVQKENGVVFEEYIYDGPLAYDLIFDFKFITNYREYSNKFEEQFRYYFRNKRNIIIVNNERFSIGPVSYDNFSSLELVNRDAVDQRTMYVTTYELKLECFVRDLSNMQKRERPNRYKIDFQVQDEKGSTAIKTVEEFDIRSSKYSKNKPGLEE
jgi:hypothetical protein